MDKIKKYLKNLILIVLVLAVGTAGFSEDSYAASVGQVSNLTLKQYNQTTVMVKWDKVKNVTGYKVYRATSKNGTYKLVKTVKSSSTLSWKYDKQTTGKTYWHKVRAYKTSSGKTTYGKYSTKKSIKLTYTRPHYTVTLPSSINQTKNTMTISITNDSKSAVMYMVGVFAIEEKASSSAKIHNAETISYTRNGVTKEFTGKRITIKPGQTVKFKCQLDESFDYSKSSVRMTVCMRYKQRDYIGVYSASKGNKIYTPQEYYDYLF